MARPLRRPKGTLWLCFFFFFYLFDGEKTYATRWGPPTAKRNGRSIFSCSPLSPLLLLLLHLLPSSKRKDLKQQQRFVDDRGHHNNHKKKWILTSHLHFCRVPRWLSLAKKNKNKRKTQQQQKKSLN